LEFCSISLNKFTSVISGNKLLKLTGFAIIYN
jgi:hypothetical protein